KYSARIRSIRSCTVLTMLCSPNQLRDEAALLDQLRQRLFDGVNVGLHLSDALKLDFQLAHVLSNVVRRLDELVSRDDRFQRVCDLREFVTPHICCAAIRFAARRHVTVVCHRKSSCLEEEIPQTDILSTLFDFVAALLVGAQVSTRWKMSENAALVENTHRVT